MTSLSAVIRGAGAELTALADRVQLLEEGRRSWLEEPSPAPPDASLEENAEYWQKNAAYWHSRYDAARTANDLLRDRCNEASALIVAFKERIRALEGALEHDQVFQGEP